MNTKPRPARLALLPLALLLALATVIDAQPARAGAVRLTRDGPLLTLDNGQAAVRYDLDRGVADYWWAGRLVIDDAYASAALTGETETTLYSFEDGRRTYEDAPFADEIGAGVRVFVTTAFPERDAALEQQFFVYHDEPFVTQRVAVRRLSERAVAASQIEVLAAGAATAPAGGVVLDGMVTPRFYQAPFYNNDDFAAVARPRATGVLGYWLGGIVDDESGRGVVVGAVETRAWKSAVWYDGPSNSLSAHSGTRSPVDTVAPMPLTGRTVASALFLVAHRDRYFDALSDLMRAVALVEPPLPAPGLPAPIGWSAWYHHRLEMDEADLRGVTDFIAANWRDLGYRYINLDAGWNRADGDTRYDPEKFPSGIEAAVAHIHGQGLLAGAYFVPFAISPSLLDQPAPGSSYTYGDMILRDAEGRPVMASILDWEYVLDTTHPGALPLLSALARQITAYGFDFVKLDFLQIGTQEGRHYDPNVTAMEAFHRGMAAITAAWQDAGRPIFISAAISPLYVQPYVHARRVGNDVEFGQARQAKNVALSWFTGLLYHRNDPDNAVVRRSWFPGYNDGLARLHVTMAALGGTLFIAGDDPRELSPGRAALLTNPSVLALAQEPLVIRPLSLGEGPPPVWHARRADGSHVVGIFNWNGSSPARFSVRLRDLGLDERAVYDLFDLWEQAPHGRAESSFTVELPPHGVALLRLTP
jgi:alpha-galactosidase